MLCNMNSDFSTHAGHKQQGLGMIEKRPDEIVPPLSSGILIYRLNFESWLFDERGRDQLMIHHGDKTSIFWHDHIIKTHLDYAGIIQTDAASVGSARGTYLTSLYLLDIKLWGLVDADPVEGKRLSGIFVMRFEHNSVSLTDFSPCRKYFITLNEIEPQRDDRRNPIH